MVRTALLIIIMVTLYCAAFVTPCRADEIVKPRSAATQHVGEFGGKKIRYTAWVEDNFVKDASGMPGATVITVAYTRDGVSHPERRPVIFAFNGGPGAAGAMLNFGAIGPVRLAGQVRGRRDTGHFENNPSSLLDVADLVFIDPVDTGFSRAFPGENPRYWYSSTTDASSVLEAIGHWLKVHHRESSPLYLLGESYGTVRAGLILKDSKRLSFAGVILIALDVPSEGRLIPYVTSLPTMAAGAWYHHKIPRDGRTVEQVFDQACQFARTDYLSALFQGSKLPAGERAQIAKRMSQFIGLPASLIEQKNLRIDKNTYMFNLLKDQHLRTGMLDVRITGQLRPNAQGGIDDPALAVMPPRPATAPLPTPLTVGIVKNPKIGAYLKDGLHFGTDQNYYSINFIDNFYWQWNREDFDTVAAIDESMKAHPALRLMWVQGLYDLTTPAYLADYTLWQDQIPGNRLTELVLPGPHSAYTGRGNLPIFAAALRRFVMRSSTQARHRHGGGAGSSSRPGDTCSSSTH